MTLPANFIELSKFAVDRSAIAQEGPRGQLNIFYTGGASVSSSAYRKVSNELEITQKYQVNCLMRSFKMALLSVTDCYHVPSLERPPKASGHKENPHP